MKEKRTTQKLHKQLEEGIEEGSLKQVRDALEALNRANTGAIKPKKLDSYLRMAANCAQPDTVKLLIAAGADINQAENNDQALTVLHRAAGHYSPYGKYDELKDKYRDCVLALLDAGAAFPIKNKHGNTLLHSAAERRDVGMARLLLERGDDPDAEGSDGKTPLNIAAANGDLAMAKLLLEHGADMNYKNTCDGRTALHGAAFRDNADMVTFLLDAGADIDSRAENGNTPLREAVKYEQNDMVQLLVARGADVNAINRMRSTPLHSAAVSASGPREPASGNPAIIRMLLKAGASVDAKDKDGKTPLLWAAGEDNTEVARVLLDHGADINTRDSRNRTPLHLAARDPHPGHLIAFLIDRGADIHALDKRGWSPTMTMLEGRWGSWDTTHTQIKMFAAGGANTRGVLKEPGKTPMHRTVTSIDKTTAQLMLKYCDDINAATESGETVLGSAIGSKPKTARAIRSDTRSRCDVAEKLISLGAQVGRPELRALGRLYGKKFGRVNLDDRRQLFSLLLAHGVPLDGPVVEETGETLLHVMCASSNVANGDIALLLEHNRDLINARDKLGRTPLHAYLTRKTAGSIYLSGIEMLLDAGADPALADADGATVVAQARKLPERHMTLLQDYGGDLRDDAPSRAVTATVQAL